jgi:hypothetical protein
VPNLNEIVAKDMNNPQDFKICLTDCRQPGANFLFFFVGYGPWFRRRHRAPARLVHIVLNDYDARCVVSGWCFLRSSSAFGCRTKISNGKTKTCRDAAALPDPRNGTPTSTMSPVDQPVFSRSSWKTCERILRETSGRRKQRLLTPRCGTSSRGFPHRPSLRNTGCGSPTFSRG